LIANGAIALMKTITQQLNAIAIPFTFQVLYNPSDYDRYDSTILKLDRLIAIEDRHLRNGELNWKAP
jgi:HopA1 effector protein family